MRSLSCLVDKPQFSNYCGELIQGPKTHPRIPWNEGKWFFAPFKASYNHIYLFVYDDGHAFSYNVNVQIVFCVHFWFLKTYIKPPVFNLFLHSQFRRFLFFYPPFNDWRYFDRYNSSHYQLEKWDIINLSKQAQEPFAPGGHRHCFVLRCSFRCVTLIYFPKSIILIMEMVKNWKRNHRINQKRVYICQNNSNSSSSRCNKFVNLVGKISTRSQRNFLIHFFG